MKIVGGRGRGCRRGLMAKLLTGGPSDIRPGGGGRGGCVWLVGLGKANIGSKPGKY